MLYRRAFGISLALLWLSYGVLEWIRRVFEEGSKVMRRYLELMNIGSSAHEAGLVALRDHACESIIIGEVMMSRINYFYRAQND